MCPGQSWTNARPGVQAVRKIFARALPQNEVVSLTVLDDIPGWSPDTAPDPDGHKLFISARAQGRNSIPGAFLTARAPKQFVAQIVVSILYSKLLGDKGCRAGGTVMFIAILVRTGATPQHLPTPVPQSVPN